MQLAEYTYFTDDVAGTAEFYEALLEAEPVHRSDGIAIFDAGGTTLLVHEAVEPYEGGPPNEDHPAYAVDDVDAAYDDLAGEFETVAAPDDYDWGRAAYLRDPAGNLVELVAE